jgi:hypothetical protein
LLRPGVSKATLSGGFFFVSITAIAVFDSMKAWPDGCSA